MRDYNYKVGGEVVLFDDNSRTEYFGKVIEVNKYSVLCEMGINNPIEYFKGGIVPIDEVEDLFKTPELIPSEVQLVLDSFDEDADDYKELERLLDELKPLGYIFSYYLDAEPYWLRKIVQ